METLPHLAVVGFSAPIKHVFCSKPPVDNLFNSQISHIAPSTSYIYSINNHWGLIRTLFMMLFSSTVAIFSLFGRSSTSAVHIIEPICEVKNFTGSILESFPFLPGLDCTEQVADL